MTKAAGRKRTAKARAALRRKHAAARRHKKLVAKLAQQMAEQHERVNAAITHNVHQPTDPEGALVSETSEAEHGAYLFGRYERETEIYAQSNHVSLPALAARLATLFSDKARG